MSPTGAVTPLVWTPELVARFWDHESSKHGHYFAEVYGAAIVGSFSRVLTRGSRGAGGGGFWMDFGCGAGGLLPHLFPLATKVVGMDHSPKSRAEVVRRFGSQAKFDGVFAPGEIEKFAGQVDVLFCIEVIEHLDDATLAQLLGTIRQMLKNDGIAILTTPNREDLAQSEIFCPQCQSVFHRWQHVRSWDAGTLAAAVTAHGFKLLETVETDFRAHRAVSGRRWFKRKLRELRGRRVKSPHLACALTPDAATATARG